MRILRICLFFGCTAASIVFAGELPLSFRHLLKQADIPIDAVGISVQEVTDGEELLASNARGAFNPASTMKLVTTNAALDLLGPAFTWKTQAYADGAQANDVLHGNLIIKGSGDPKLVTENFWLFLRQIRARGIREIQGDLLLDRSVFEEMPYDAAMFDSDPSKPYNAGADALLLNYHAFRFRFFPNEETTGVTVVMDPPAADYPVVAPKLSSDECGDWQRKLAVHLGNAAVFSGTYAASCSEKTWYLHPHTLTPTQYFGAVFKRMWADLGGVFHGQVRNGVTPPEARLITEWESSALSELIRDINKYSNNVMARQLLLTLAAQTDSGPANTEQGARVIQTWLRNKNIDAPELVIQNGSGLSRIERIAPHTMVRILIAAFKSPLMPEFMASMSLVGYDGTMRYRLRNHSVAGHAHIKTGRIDDVRAVVGYVLAASGKRYAVACMINHRNAERGREALDALLQWVYEAG